MSLYSTNYVNHRLIGDLRVTRLSPMNIVDGTEVCHYEWEYKNNRMDGGVDVLTGEVDHKFSEGAPELLAKVYIHISAIQNGQS